MLWCHGYTHTHTRAHTHTHTQTRSHNTTRYTHSHTYNYIQHTQTHTHSLSLMAHANHIIYIIFSPLKVNDLLTNAFRRRQFTIHHDLLDVGDSSTHTFYTGCSRRLICWMWVILVPSVLHCSGTSVCSHSAWISASAQNGIVALGKAHTRSAPSPHEVESTTDNMAPLEATVQQYSG